MTTTGQQMSGAGWPDFLTVEQATAILRTGRTVAYALARRYLATDGAEGLPVIRIGHQLRVPRALLERWLGAPLTPRTGKTTMLAAAVDDLTVEGRTVFGVAPTAKAARVLEAETRLPADTIAKLLHEHLRPDRPPLARYQLPAGTTLIADESGMIGTTTLHRLTDLADRYDWRVVLVGDPRQLQAVGRGGMFGELCATGRVHQLVTVHRFTHDWEPAASLRLRHGDVTAFDTCEAHGRITAGSLDTHLDRLARDWIDHHANGRTVTITATTNDHVDAINDAIQRRRAMGGDIAAHRVTVIGGGERACIGDIVVTRRNDRTPTTSTGDTVRNRDRWTITATHRDGAITVTPLDGHGTVRLPVDYVRDDVRLGYAATEHCNQGVTVDVAYHLVNGTTTSRGLYVDATRGRDLNQFLVATDTNDVADARDVLDRVLTFDRADMPATVQRRHLHAIQQPAPVPVSVPEPVPVWVPEPDWLWDWRYALGTQRDEIHERQRHDEHRRTDAAAALETIAPAVTAARAAWQPYQTRLGDLEQHLARELRPTMHRANNNQRAARFGHRHRAERTARDATAAVHEAEAQVQEIRKDGRDVKARLDQVVGRADQLRTAAEPHPAWSYEHQLLDHIDRLATAIDTWNEWNAGQPTTVAALVDSLDTLTAEARRAPALALRAGEITPSQLDELTEPLGQWLVARGITPRVRVVEHSLEHDSLGIDL
jgi:hypothetical protein